MIRGGRHAAGPGRERPNQEGLQAHQGRPGGAGLAVAEAKGEAVAALTPGTTVALPLRLVLAGVLAIVGAGAGAGVALAEMDGRLEAVERDVDRHELELRELRTVPASLEGIRTLLESLDKRTQRIEQTLDRRG